VYRFRDARQRVLYIGCAVNLRRRVASYWSGSPSRIAEMVERIVHLEAVSCCSAHEAAWLERNLIEQRRPPWNRTAGGLGVAVFLRLDWRTGTPGLSVTHSMEPADQARYFGPYLGGGRVRLAAAALRRLMPLAYSGEALSGSGLELARVRGVEPGARPQLVEAITRVLERSPAALASARATLVGWRDAASASLDFERAASIQAELNALDWVVAEQNVTLLEPRAFDACGWSGGILVEFQFRGGRLCSWTQRRCTELDAQRRLVATPARWRDFAGRNAQLAAWLANGGGARVRSALDFEPAGHGTPPGREFFPFVHAQQSLAGRDGRRQLEQVVDSQILVRA
jgi:excinuclease ABC subunit C